MHLINSPTFMKLLNIKSIEFLETLINVSIIIIKLELFITYGFYKFIIFVCD